MSLTFPGESAEYRAARIRLLEQEIQLRRAMEAVAAARRELPPGGAAPEDYVFGEAGADGAPTEVRLSELFAPGKDSLVIYNFMFPRTYGGDRPGPRSGQTAHWSVDGGESRHFRIVACANVRFVTAAFAAAHAECAAVRRSPGRGW